MKAKSFYKNNKHNNMNPKEKENNQAVYQRIGCQQTNRKQNLVLKKVGVEPSVDISEQQIQ